MTCLMNLAIRLAGVDFDNPAERRCKPHDACNRLQVHPGILRRRAVPVFAISVTNGARHRQHSRVYRFSDLRRCPMNVYTGTGDLLEGANPLDTSQTVVIFYRSYDVAWTKYGSYQIIGLQLVTDGSWSQMGDVQTSRRNVNINDDLSHLTRVRRGEIARARLGRVETRANSFAYKSQCPCKEHVDTD